MFLSMPDDFFISDSVAYIICDKHKGGESDISKIYEKYPKLRLKHLMTADRAYTYRKSFFGMKGIDLYRDETKEQYLKIYGKCDSCYKENGELNECFKCCRNCKSGDHGETICEECYSISD